MRGFLYCSVARGVLIACRALDSLLRVHSRSVSVPAVSSLRQSVLVVSQLVANSTTHVHKFMIVTAGGRYKKKFSFVPHSAQ